MYKDRKVQAWRNRCAKRTYRHGNWRQVFIDCGGACAHCGSFTLLEFHEQFGEDHKGDGKMQQRLLLCNSCHKEEEQHWNVNGRRHNSLVCEDVQAEIDWCGGMDAWAERYSLDLSRWGSRIVLKWGDNEQN